MKEPIRLSKLMSERGICSRREADRYIETGQVLVNGEVISELGTRVSPDVEITLKEKATEKQREKVTIILNKPLGIVSTQPEKGYTPAIDLIRDENHWKEGQKGDEGGLQPRHIRRLSVAGRLDIDSKGLLVFTQDGAIVKQIIGPHADLEKEYLVSVEGEVTKEMLRELQFGLSLDGKALKRAKVEQLDDDLIRFVLKEGKKRQIRRMCDLVGLRVIKLKRVRVGNVRLGKLPEGMWRFLNPGEHF